MPDWSEVYVHRMERGFYDQGAPEVTIPIGTVVFWIDDPDDESRFNRPEMDRKDTELGHTEVYEGRFSCNGFFISATGRFWLVTDPIYVENGRPVRASMMYMHKFDGSQCGGRLGIVNGDGPFGGVPGGFPPGSGVSQDPSITWGPWLASHSGHGHDVWGELTAPEVVPTEGHVRIVLQFNNDYPAFAGAHGDVMILEQLGNGGTVPPGDCSFDWTQMEQLLRDVFAETQLCTQSVRQIMREELDKTRLSG